MPEHSENMQSAASSGDTGVRAVGSMSMTVLLSTAEKALSLKHYVAARRLFEEALLRKPYSVRGLGGLGRLCIETNDVEAAISNFFRLMIYRPQSPNAISGYGHACSMLDEFRAARKWYGRAEAADPDNRATSIALGVTQLRLGDWEDGFLRYDLREGVASLEKSIGSDKIWDGKADIGGKRVLVVGEQGLGDQIQFMRYCNLLKELGAYIIFFTREPLAELCSWMHSIDEVILNDAKANFDYAVMAMSLPRLFSSRPDHIPMRAGYLFPPAECSSHVANNASRKTKIAVAWTGNPENSRNEVRSCPAELFTDLVRHFSDIEFYAFPFDITPDTEELATLVEPLCEAEEVLAVTASRLKTFDLVLTVDTSLVHLAGALGVPAWLLLGRQPDWRWLAEGDDSLWYDSVRVFRTTGNWKELIDRVTNELDLFLKKRPGGKDRN